MNAKLLVSFVLMMATLFDLSAVAAERGDAERGETLFRQCIACHSVTASQHLTGPSLYGVVGRRAGTAEGFGRYSKAMLAAEWVWTEDMLDRWLESPGKLIPETSMRITGVSDPDARADVIAYLKSVGEPGQPTEPVSDGGSGMQPGKLENLKELSPKQRIARIRYCSDAYHVTLGNGETFPFWEFNLRFKTDSSANGPEKGQPAILRGGMMGDRAFVIFAGPEEISALIERAC